MNDSEFLESICEGYVQCFRTQDLGQWNTYTDDTHRAIEYFSRLGEMLGFYVAREVNRKDLAWYDDPDRKKLVLHLEHETERDRAIVALENVLKSNARFLVAVLVGELLDSDIQMIRAQVCAKAGNQSIAVIAKSQTLEKGLPNERSVLTALVCCPSGLRTRKAIKSVDKAHYWYAYFLEDWKEEQFAQHLAAPNSSA